jgi:hypothetical protein
MSMNIQLVESLANAIKALSSEEQEVKFRRSFYTIK